MLDDFDGSRGKKKVHIYAGPNKRVTSSGNSNHVCDLGSHLRKKLIVLMIRLKSLRDMGFTKKSRFAIFLTRLMYVGYLPAITEQPFSSVSHPQELVCAGAEYGVFMPKDGFKWVARKR